MDSKYLNIDPQKREAIIEASLREFAEQGYDNASTNVMAREAGISKALFFHYVNNKKDLFLFLFDYSFKIMEKEFLGFFEQLKKEKDFFARMRLAGQFKMGLLYQKYPNVYAFYAVASLTDSEQFKEYFDARNESLIKTSIELMHEGIDESGFREGIDIPRALQVILWANEGFAYELHKKLNTRKGFKVSQAELDGYLAEYYACLAVLEKSFYK